ncbi:hypothetical protein EDB89DRAFT_680309 [Lactarius sanguifluus]|nr:hypothetical protein EDB89DRAFT_680309 [Lactarius sanguifluus]
MAMGKRETCRSKQRRLFLSSRYQLPHLMSIIFYRDLVIASLGVTSEKFVHASMCSNLRVVTLAPARILARHLAVDVGPCEPVTLRQVVRSFRWSAGSRVAKGLHQLRGAVETSIRKLRPADFPSRMALKGFPWKPCRVVVRRKENWGC